MRWIAAAALAACLPAVAAVAEAPPAAALSAAQIIERNIAARGGLEAWRKVETMTWSGHVQSSPGSGPPLPFSLEMKRPNKTHFELTRLHEKFLRVFDGVRGWKLRPGASGLPEMQPFSMEEMKFSREEFVIDGPLMDHELKRVSVSLESVDEIEGRKAFRMSIKLPSGAPRRVWIDAETFLDIKHDRPSSNPLNPRATVSVFYRDYRAVDGLQIPHRVETATANGNAASTLQIERVMVNPALEDQSFAKPSAPTKRRATVSIGGESPPWRGH
jgi:hypothetical protein